MFHGQFWGPEQISAYLSGVPDDRLIMLDLISEASPAYERTNYYHGKPFMWSLLHNFGGQVAQCIRLANNSPAAASGLAVLHGPFHQSQRLKARD